MVFFAIVNYAIDCMLIAKNKNLDIAFEWKSNLYGNPDQDCWSYYFENNRLMNLQKVISLTLSFQNMEISRIDMRHQLEYFINTMVEEQLWIMPI